MGIRIVGKSYENTRTLSGNIIYATRYQIGSSADVTNLPTPTAAGGADIYGDTLPACLPGSKAWTADLKYLTVLDNDGTWKVAVNRS